MSLGADLYEHKIQKEEKRRTKYRQRGKRRKAKRLISAKAGKHEHNMHILWATSKTQQARHINILFSHRTHIRCESSEEAFHVLNILSGDMTLRGVVAGVRLWQGVKTWMCCGDERIHIPIKLYLLLLCEFAKMPVHPTKQNSWDGMNSRKSYIVWNDIICTELQRKINNMHTIAFELSLHACFTIWFSFIMNVTMIIKMIKLRLNSFS